MSESPFEFDLNIEDIPDQPPAKGFAAEGIIGEISVKETSTGNIMVTVPLSYPADQVDRKTFKFVYFLDPAWLRPGFDKTSLDEKAQQQYNMNYGGKFKNMFKLTGNDKGPADTKRLTGAKIGFTTKPGFRDPSQLEGGRFFAPKQPKKQEGESNEETAVF